MLARAWSSTGCSRTSQAWPFWRAGKEFALLSGGNAVNLEEKQNEERSKDVARHVPCSTGPRLRTGRPDGERATAGCPWRPGRVDHERTKAGDAGLHGLGARDPADEERAGNV